MGAVPASQPSQQFRIWLNQLADPNAEVREGAAQNLMGMQKYELPILQKIVEEASPLLPSQIALLHDVVMQVFVSGTENDVEADPAPFLGVSMENNVGEPTEAVEGVVVKLRLLGFEDIACSAMATSSWPLKRFPTGSHYHRGFGHRRGQGLSHWGYHHSACDPGRQADRRACGAAPKTVGHSGNARPVGRMDSRAAQAGRDVLE